MAKNNTTADRVQAAMNFIGGDDMLDRLIAGTAELTIIVTRHLTASTTFFLPADKNQKRLEDCEGVVLLPDVKQLFATVLKPLAQKRRKFTYCDLTENLNDFDIIEELGDEEVVLFDSVEILEATISQMVAVQLDGKPGKLLNNEKANIFYLRDPNNSERILFVSVRWSYASLRYRVDLGGVDANPWNTGNRVFLATVA